MVSRHADIQSGTDFQSKWTSRFPYMFLLQFFYGIPNNICCKFFPKGVWIPYHCSSSLTPAGPIPCGKEGSGLSQCYHSCPGEPRLLGRPNPIQPSSDTEQHLYPHLCPPLFEAQMDFDGVPRWVAEPLPWYGILHGSFH